MNQANKRKQPKPPTLEDETRLVDPYRLKVLQARPLRPTMIELRELGWAQAHLRPKQGPNP